MKFSVRGVVVLLAALAAAGGTAGLGFWQLDRASQKQSLHAAMQSKGELPPLQNADLSRLVDESEASGLQMHRRALLRGRWLSERTVFLDNRPMNGRVGFFVVTPLQLAGRSELILVQRGWSPRDASDRSRTQSVPAPAAVIDVPGRLIAAPSKVYEFEAAPQAVIRQNLDTQAFSKELGKPFLPLTLLQTDDARIGDELVADGLLRTWQPPDAGLHKHYGYAFQWFLLSALILGLYVWFQAICPRKRLKSD